MKYSYDRRPPFKVEVEVYGFDGKDSILRLLKFIRFMGSIGTSRGIRLDDNDTTITGWDGDGADKIGDILLDGKKVEMTDEEKADFNEITR